MPILSSPVEHNSANDSMDSCRIPASFALKMQEPFARCKIDGKMGGEAVYCVGSVDFKPTVYSNSILCASTSKTPERSGMRGKTCCVDR